jgi:hypothetical protein
MVIGAGDRRCRVQVRPTAGFFYRCRAWSGCTSSLRSLEAYDGDGHLVCSDSLPAPGGYVVSGRHARPTNVSFAGADGSLAPDTARSSWICDEG